MRSEFRSNVDLILIGYPNRKIVLFDDADWNKHLMGVTTNVKNIGDANDKVSSLRVERP